MPIRRSQVFTASCCIALLLTACDRSGNETASDTEVASEAPTEIAATTIPRTPSPSGARVFIISPTDGATVSNPVKIEFGIEGMELAKAGDNKLNTGHHHLIVDAGMPDESLPIPANDNYIHFGDASASVELTLEPGSHTLCLLLGDHLHIPHDPPVISEMITIVVE